MILRTRKVKCLEPMNEPHVLGGNAGASIPALGEHA